MMAGHAERNLKGCIPEVWMLLAVGGNGRDCPFNPNCSHSPTKLVISGTGDNRTCHEL